MSTSTMELLPGTEVHARGLRWEVVSSESLGPETLFRLRGLENAVLGEELDILYPFEEIEPVIHNLRPERAAQRLLPLTRVPSHIEVQSSCPSPAVEPAVLRGGNTSNRIPLAKSTAT